MEPVHLVCAHDACYRDWPWLCYVNFDAVAKFDGDDDAQNPVLVVVWGSLEELLEASWRHFCKLWTVVWLFLELRRSSLNGQADV